MVSTIYVISLTILEVWEETPPTTHKTTNISAVSLSTVAQVRLILAPAFNNFILGYGNQWQSTQTACFKHTHKQDTIVSTLIASCRKHSSLLESKKSTLDTWRIYVQNKTNQCSNSFSSLWALSVSDLGPRSVFKNGGCSACHPVKRVWHDWTTDRWERKKRNSFCPTSWWWNCILASFCFPCIQVHLRPKNEM